ncbi:heavy metal sensor histidine kinase [Paracidovorax anthurii]|uniref:Sensor protein n=1 Tax=Paracidovorax anthurii TaxID=78229 RepID=A0A328ZFG5_9BURK|nr:heavy metal sensor histidine kinase [Paracidovorax anthurii]RAR84801.1 two-component system heavy metal sensor histidine kinase CusS [Paracidovorax anthurii]
MKAAPGGHAHAASLGATLSRWLAVQTVLGLGVVCGAVYLVIALTMAQRQEEAIAQKEGAVMEVLAGHRPGHGAQAAAHMLDDMLAGHSELALRVADAQGRVVYARNPELVAADDAHLRRTFEINGPPESRRAVYATLVLDTRADDALLRRLAWTLLIAALAGAAVVSLGAFWRVRQGLSPLRHLVAQTAGLTATGTGQRLDGSAQPTELQPLIAQFNALLDRASGAYGQMEAFNADVAHELNTPLATLISSCELALRRSRGEAELQETLASNLEELRRLAGIVADMLFLSQADRGAAARSERVPALSALAIEVLEFHEAAIQDAGLRAEIVGDAPATVDARLLRRALSNLLGNATRYATPGSVVQVCIGRMPGPPETVSLSVRNQGPGIEARHLPRIFDRFYRVDTARPQADRNHGLGLAIVSAIARMHGGEAFAASGAGWVEIGIRLPAGEGHPVSSCSHARDDSCAP